MDRVWKAVYQGAGLDYDHVMDTGFTGGFPTHSHDVCELLFVRSGDLTYMVEGKSYHIGNHTLILSHPMEAHALTANGTILYDRYNLQLEEKIISRELYDRIPKSINVMNFDGNETVRQIFKKMDHYCLRGDDPLRGRILRNLTEEVLYQVLLAVEAGEQEDICTAHPVVTQAIAYINGNIATPLDVGQVCEALYISKSYLHHLFVKHLHITPKKYIITKKLLMAQRELLSDSNPTGVYQRYGFANYSTFYRNYKQYFGCAPSEGEHPQAVREYI